ncbi:MAG: MFS transporter [Planctomycetota bacterium]|nr:MFS transporter [Planctomycetota bacterium]
MEEEVTSAQHKRNLFFFTMVEMFWGIGLGFVHTQAIAPAFLDDLGATAAFIGLVAAVFAGGSLTAQFFSGFIAERLKRRKPIVLLLHFLLPLTWLFVFSSIYYFVTLDTNYHIGRYSLLISATIYSLLLGTLLPIYFAFVSALVKKEHRAEAFGLIFAAQCIAGALTIYFVGGITKQWQFPQNYAMLYLFASLVIIGGNLFLLGTREKIQIKEISLKRNLKQYLKSQIRLLFVNKPFQKYIYARLFLCVNQVILSFLVKFAKEKFEIGGTEWARLFAFYFLLGQAAGNLLFGKIADKLGYKSAAVVGSFLVAPTLIVALYSPTPQTFMLSQILAGMSVASMWVTHMNITIAYAPTNERAHYIGLSAVLSAIPTGIGSIAAGWVMDALGFEVLSAAVLVVGGIGTAFLVFAVKLPKPEEAKRIPPVR